MLTRGEAAATYERISNILHNEAGFIFHTTDGEDISSNDLNYKKFTEILPTIEYLDTTSDNYDKLYINPFMRVLLAVSSDKQDNEMVSFDRISFEMMEFVYEQFRQAVNHGYRLALDDARKNISNLFKMERNLDDID